MKHQVGKIKNEHHILKEFDKFLDGLSLFKCIKRIIPGRIYRQQKGTSKKSISISYKTNSGLKILMKKGSTVQEVFLICDEDEKQFLIDEIGKYI